MILINLHESPAQDPKYCGEHWLNKINKICPGSTLVPITARDMGSARLATRPPAECTVNVTSTGKAKPVTSRTAGTTVEVPTTATATSPGRSCVYAMTVGKVRATPAGACKHLHSVLHFLSLGQQFK